MNYPPICPKSKRIIRQTDTHGAVRYLFVLHNYYLVALECEQYHDLIAAYQEVEWRKRAERWAKVRDRLVGTAKCKLKICASNAEWDCQFNAAAWRAWGEKVK